MPSDDDDMSRHFDVVVIGAGPAGEAAAEIGGTAAVASADLLPITQALFARERRPSRHYQWSGGYPPADLAPQMPSQGDSNS
jgi:flavin-dependent dehydrogenase